MIEIRCCEGLDELDACVALEMETWGYDVTEIVPRKTFLLAQKIGGQVIGAFEAGSEPPQRAKIVRQGPRQGARGQGSEGTHAELIGFAMSLPGIKEIEGRAVPYLHSHMLAVKPGYRNLGIGAQLKREQRSEALMRGIRLMEWTFDPLELKNAFLNIHRLGAIVRSYRPNFYGVSSSRLQAGLPTDRLLAEWELDSPRVQAHLDSDPTAATNTQVVERIMVPASIERWKANEQDREYALTVQAENRDKFQQAFSRGLVVLGFCRDAEGNGVYELGIPTQAEQVLTAKAANSL